jgi:hypothetical protein
MMMWGTPYLVMISLKNLMVDEPSSFLIGLASIHLVNLSTTTNRCVKPPGAVLNGPTMSRPQTANGQVSGMVLRAAAGVFLCLEKHWQPLHYFTSCSAFCLAVGQ